METLKQFALRFFEENRAYLETHYPGITSRRLLSEIDEKCSSSQWPRSATPNDESVQWFFHQLLQGTPLQYLSGISHFHHFSFAVSPDVLIPRSETEELVELALSLCQEKEIQTMADVGTGSGNIALSILASVRKPLRVFASDISEEALNVARKNEETLRSHFHQSSVIQWVHGDRLQGLPLSLDLIVSNPPYIPWSESQTLVHRQVHDYEPHRALYLPDDDYAHWFDDFFRMAFAHLKSGGWFIMEGHENKLREQALQLSRAGFQDVEVIRDLSTKDRFLKAYRP